MRWVTCCSEHEGEEDPDNLKRTAGRFKEMSVESFDEHCDTVPDTLKYPLLDRMVEDIRRFLKLRVLESRPYEHINLHINQPHKMTSQRRRKRIMQTVNAMVRSYERTRS